VGQVRHVDTLDHPGWTAHCLSLGWWRSDPRCGISQTASRSTDGRTRPGAIRPRSTTPAPAPAAAIRRAEEGSETPALVPRPTPSIATREPRRQLKYRPTSGRRFNRWPDGARRSTTLLIPCSLSPEGPAGLELFNARRSYRASPLFVDLGSRGVGPRLPRACHYIGHTVD